MDSIVKQLTNTVGGVIHMANIMFSPYKVKLTNFDVQKLGKLFDEMDPMYLFKHHNTVECVILGVGLSSKCYSLFRLTNEKDACVMFQILSSTLLPLAFTCPQLLTEDILQKLCDCSRERRTWNVAHVVAFVGMTDALKQADLQQLVNSPCPAIHLTPLMSGVLGKNLDCVQELLSIGASIIQLDMDGNSAYHYAVTSCPLAISILRQHDSDGIIDYPNIKGETALYICCLKKMADVVEILVQCGADPGSGATSMLPVHVTVLNNDLKSLEIILNKHDAQKDAKDSMGRTLLHHACSEEMVNRLSLLGCDMNVTNADGDTPLLVMMRERRLTCIIAMLSNGADCNVQDSKGETVLHLAIKDGSPDLIRMLIVFNADPNIRNVHNQSCRHLATTSSCKERELILYILHMSGASRCTADVKGCLSGCTMEGSHNGQPDSDISKLLRMDSVSKFDELLSATGNAVANSGSNSSSSILDMLSIPSDIGYRVLSLDGGGIRGLVMIQMLMEIEAIVGRPIKHCFDWIGGTSTGGILALAIARGFSLKHLKGLFVRMKDEVFKGSRPYDSCMLESMLKREFGETSVMTDIVYPKNYDQPFKRPHTDSESSESNRFASVSPPSEQLLWKAARSTGAAPTYFRAFGCYLDGGLMSNNPTLDLLTDINEYNIGLRMSGRLDAVRKIGCVVSLGTGRIPSTEVRYLDVYYPTSIWDSYRIVSGVVSLLRLLADQATVAEGRVVDRARAWCSVTNVPHFRFSPQLLTDVPLDCHDHTQLINMMWETQCYMVANRHRVYELTNLLCMSG